MKGHTELGERPQSLQNFETEGWISANDRLDALRICAFKILDTSDTSIDKLADRDSAYVGHLNHLQWAVIPGS